MKKEVIVTFETAKLAKEKGFNWPTYKEYEHSLTEQEHEYDGKSGPFGWEKGETNLTSNYFINNWKECDYSNNAWYCCSAPTQSFLQKWFREEHRISIEANWLPNKGTYRALYTPMDIQPKFLTRSEMVKHILKYIGVKDFDTYEEALEEGLQQALKLI